MLLVYICWLFLNINFPSNLTSSKKVSQLYFTLQDTTSAHHSFQEGMAFMKNEKLDSSNFYFDKANKEFGKFGIVNRQIECLNHIGHNNRKQSQYKASEKAFNEALSLSNAKFGTDHLMTATCLHNTGMISDILGDYSTASQNLHKALKIRLELKKDNNP
ncbi:unnamed protein product, partial [Scytosiphon promiscuus]